MVESVVSFLSRRDRFVLVTHVRPDGDAIGSQLGLGLFLRKVGKDVLMINAHQVPKNIDWLARTEEIQIFDGSFLHLQQINSADAIIVLDLNSGNRLGSLEGAVRDAKCPKVLIDHHSFPESWFDISYARESAAATSVLVYELLMAWNGGYINGQIANALFVGIMTDTGSFRHPTVTPEVHRIAADLLSRASLSASEMFGSVYNHQPPEWPRLLGRVLNTLALDMSLSLGYITITNHMLRSHGARPEDTEGFVDFVLAVEGIDVAIVFLEVPGKGTKVSWRSLGHRAIDGWARSLGGGGHSNAAGAFVKASLNDTIKQVISNAPRFLVTKSMVGKSVLSSEDTEYYSMLMDV